jgi:CspA family cold shock protein
MSAGMTDTVASGRVTQWNRDRGFGFIERDDGGGTTFVFCHIRNVVSGCDELCVGQRVRFQVAVNERNRKPEARSVEMI